MDDGIRELAERAVDFARKIELTNEEEAELLALVAAAYRAGRADGVDVVRVAAGFSKGRLS